MLRREPHAHPEHRPPWDASGAGRQLAESNSPVLVEVPLEDLAVGLQPGLANMFTIATCCAARDNQQGLR